MYLQVRQMKGDRVLLAVSVRPGRWQTERIRQRVKLEVHLGLAEVRSHPDSSPSIPHVGEWATRHLQCSCRGG
jgi:hypothetical protein